MMLKGKKKNDFEVEGSWRNCLYTFPALRWRLGEWQPGPAKHEMCDRQPSSAVQTAPTCVSPCIPALPPCAGIGSAPPHLMGRSAVPQWGLQLRSAVLLQMRRGWGPCWCLFAMQAQKCLLVSTGPGAVCCCNTGLEKDSNLRGQEGASGCTDTCMEIIW